MDTIAGILLGLFLLCCLIGCLGMFLVFFLTEDMPTLAKWILVAGVVGFIVWRVV